MRRVLRLTAFHCVFLGIANAGTAEAQGRVLVRGAVTDSTSRAPISGAYVEIPDTRFSTRSGDDGSFTLGRLPTGRYSVRIVRLGFAPNVVDPLEVTPSDTGIFITAMLTPAAIPLAAVIVTPGFYGVMQPGLTPGHTLSHHQLETAPQLGEDVYRSVARLPGVANNDMSARFNVRGAPGEELYATLDGLELDEPFHLKDIDAALSILDVNSIAGIELATGGFSAEYGNRLTGVFTMHSVEPRTDRTRTTLALSILNMRYTSEGGMADGRLGWYVSARRGYLDIALKLVSPEDSLSPGYYDVFAKVRYDLPKLGRVTLHALHAGDHLNYLEEQDHLKSHYNTSYLWATWEGQLSERLRQTTVLSAGKLGWKRHGDIFDQDGARTMQLEDRRAYDVAALRQDWMLELGPSLLIKAGIEGKAMNAVYEYDSWILRRFLVNNVIVNNFDTITAATNPRGSMLGVYVSQRTRLMPSLTAETGVRYDNASYADDGDVSPRLNLAWEPFTRTTVRAAWGRYAQSQPIYSLQVGDGLASFAPSERAEHRGVGVEQRLRESLTLRLELYDRRLTRPRPKFINQANQLVVFPELEFDRLRIDPSSGRARGLEAFVQRAGKGRLEWSAAYALASVMDRLGARDVPRGMDQRHTANADWAFRPLSNKWRVSLAWTWHSGWPATPSTFRVDTLSTSPMNLWVTSQFGVLASERLPEYRRFDVRYTRFFDTRRRRVALYADVFNLFNRRNPRGYEYSLFFNPSFTVQRGYDLLLPRLPSLGLSWEF